jgi:ankyrin repeat protein
MARLCKLVLMILLLVGCGRSPPVRPKAQPKRVVKEDEPFEPVEGVKPFSVALELDELESKSINYDEPFPFLLRNNTKEPIQIWDPSSRRGCRQFSLELTNPSTGHKYVLRRSFVGDEASEESEAELDEDSRTVEIPPGATYKTDFRFSEFKTEGVAAFKLITPNTGQTFLLTAQFEATVLGKDQDASIWTGTIRSEEENILLVYPRLKTVCDYLEAGHTDKAIEMMAADPTLVNTPEGEHKNTPLHAAARHGAPQAVKWLLDHGADVNAITSRDATPLHSCRDIESARFLLEKKPDLSICNSDNRTAIQVAGEILGDAPTSEEREKWRSIVRIYLEAGAECDLLTAICLDDLERVKKILKQTPALADDFQKQSPLRKAAHVGSFPICRLLIEEYHVDVNDFERGVGYPIIIGALAHPDVVRLLIDHGADLKERITWRGGRTGIWIIGDDATALHYAADDGHPETVRLLIDHGVDIFAAAHDYSEKTDQTALEVASFFGNAATTKAIVDHPLFDEAKPELRQALLDKSLWDGCFPSWLARKPKRVELIKVLLAKGANPNARFHGQSPMQVAAGAMLSADRRESAEIKQIVNLLRQHGARVDLFSMIAMNDEEAVQAILKKSPSDAAMRSGGGYPALHLAIAMGNRSIVKMLIDAGVDLEMLNESDRSGTEKETPLHCAASGGEVAIAEQLVAAGANVNARDKDQATPLHNAAAFENVRIARLLLEHGADPTLTDADGRTPLDYCSDDRIMETLLNKYLPKKED